MIHFHSKTLVYFNCSDLQVCMGLDEAEEGEGGGEGVLLFVLFLSSIVLRLVGALRCVCLLRRVSLRLLRCVSLRLLRCAWLLRITTHLHTKPLMHGNEILYS